MQPWQRSPPPSLCPKGGGGGIDHHTHKHTHTHTNTGLIKPSLLAGRCLGLARGIRVDKYLAWNRELFLMADRLISQSVAFKEQRESVGPVTQPAEGSGPHNNPLSLTTRPLRTSRWWEVVCCYSLSLSLPACLPLSLSLSLSPVIYRCLPVSLSL